MTFQELKETVEDMLKDRRKDKDHDYFTITVEFTSSKAYPCCQHVPSRKEELVWTISCSQLSQNVSANSPDLVLQKLSEALEQAETRTVLPSEMKDVDALPKPQAKPEEYL